MTINDLVNEGFSPAVAERLNEFSPQRAYKTVRKMGFTEVEARGMIRYYIRTVYQPIIQMHRNKQGKRLY
jgi:hypothetical protein